MSTAARECGRTLLALALCTAPAAAQDPAPRTHAQATPGELTSFDGTRIHYETAGRGTPVLLVHGFVVDGSSWRRSALYDELVDHGYRVIVPDLRGNGASDHPHDAAAYEHDAEARDLIALADRLELDSYCVVGYSRGSIIAARLLVLDPRVRCAVLGGMGADFTDPGWPRRRLFYRALAGDPVPELQGLIDHVERSGLDRAALALMQKAQPSTSPAELGRLRLPVLVISGDADHENGSAAELAGLIPGARLATVPGDHNRTVGTEPFAAAVREFLDANRPRP